MSLVGNAGVVRMHINTELAAGKLIGPIAWEVQAHIQPSPIGLVSKGHIEDKWWLLAPRPDVRSMNVE